MSRTYWANRVAQPQDMVVQSTNWTEEDGGVKLFLFFWRWRHVAGGKQHSAQTPELTPAPKYRGQRA
jgi:hypothetical protein